MGNNFWKHFTERRQMNSGSFKNVNLKNYSLTKHKRINMSIALLILIPDIGYP